MKKNKKYKEKGFTIIEVVLVLAIAGLIFLMVFVALPALQRSQRDTQRRDDMARVSTALENYRANNSNKLPGDTTTKLEPSAAANCHGDTGAKSTNESTGSACKFIARYMNTANAGENSFIDPDDTTYGMYIQTYSSGDGYVSDVDHIVYIYKKAQCNGEAVTGGDNTNEYAIVYRLEGAGMYCADNQ